MVKLFGCVSDIEVFDPKALSAKVKKALHAAAGGYVKE